MILRALSVRRRATRASSRRRSRGWPGRSSARPTCRSASRTRSRSSSPPTTRPRTSATSSTRCRPRSAGCGTEVLVVDDGSRDGTGDVAAEHGALVARHVTNRGGGAALRTGYRLMVESGAEIVVTLDADGQHLPSEMPRLVQPVLDGEVDIAHGSRVLGHADRNTSPASSASSSSTASSPSSPAPTSPTAPTATAPSAPRSSRSWSCARSSSTPPSS